MEISRKNLVLSVNGNKIKFEEYYSEHVHTLFDIVRWAFDEVLESQGKYHYDLDSQYNPDYELYFLKINGVTTKHRIDNLITLNSMLLKATVEERIKELYQKVKDIIIEIEKMDFDIEISVK